MMWEWVVMPQGLKTPVHLQSNSVALVVRTFGDCAPKHFDEIFLHSLTTHGATNLEVYL